MHTHPRDTDALRVCVEPENGPRLNLFVAYLARSVMINQKSTSKRKPFSDASVSIFIHHVYNKTASEMGAQTNNF